MAPLPRKPSFTLDRLGSQFTATAVMMLVEDGRIRLDDSITKYLRGAPATRKEVTIRELLSHTAGLEDTIMEHAAGIIGADNIQLSGWMQTPCRVTDSLLGLPKMKTVVVLGVAAAYGKVYV
jgi:CubicO group peptidase (beta-lactamase class C family)